MEDNRLDGRAILRCRVARRTLDRLALDLHRLRGHQGDGRRRATARSSPTAAAGSSSACSDRSSAGDELTVAISYGGRPAPVRRPARRRRLGGARRRRDRRRPAARRAVLVPLQRPAVGQGDVRRRASPPRGYHVVCQRRAGRAAARGEHDDLGATSSPSRWRPTSRPCRSAATPCVGWPTQPVPIDLAAARGRPRRLRGPFARQARDDERLRPAVRRTTRSRRRTRSVVTEDDLEIPLEAQGLSIFGSNFLADDWSHRAARRPRALPPVVRQQPDDQRAGATSGCTRGFACYSEWLWSEESGRDTADVKAREHWKRLADLPQDLRARRPRTRRHVRRPGLQAGSAARCTPCG